MRRNTSLNNAFHGIAHTQGAYWIAGIINLMQGKRGHTGFHYPLIVAPNGDVFGAGQAYRLSMGDVPPSKHIGLPAVV